jgi:hypothetical protein
MFPSSKDGNTWCLLLAIEYRYTNRDNSVWRLSCGLDKQEVRFRLSTGVRNLSLSHSFQADFGVHPIPYLVGTMDHFEGVKKDRGLNIKTYILYRNEGCVELYFNPCMHFVEYYILIRTGKQVHISNNPSIQILNLLFLLSTLFY